MTLTINIDENKLQAVRSIVERRGKTLEKDLEDYLNNLLREDYHENNFISKPASENALQESNENSKTSIMLMIRKLQDDAGIKPIEDFDERKDYREHIIRKHA